MGQPTVDQVNLMLRLYELRREPRLRQARAWYVDKYSATSVEEVMSKYPPGSEESTNIRMVVSYWDMCAGIANRGLVDEDLFFRNSGEAWLVWEKLRPVVGAWRTGFKNPGMFEDLEQFVTRLEAWREKRAPGSNEAMRQFMAQMAQGQARAQAGR